MHMKWKDKKLSIEGTSERFLEPREIKIIQLLFADAFGEDVLGNNETQAKVYCDLFLKPKNFTHVCISLKRSVSCKNEMM